MQKKKILIFFGGNSPEYSVSLESSSGIISKINTDKYEPVLVGITKSGSWYHFSGDVSQIADDTWHSVGKTEPAMLSPDCGKAELLVFSENEIKRIKIDAALPILHGKNGEDGTIQGLLDLAGIAIIGCGTLSSALCMDKDRAHKLVEFAGIRVPKSISLTDINQIDKVYAFAEEISYPVFVKPVRAGSSYGIAKVENRQELLPAVSNAFEFDKTVLVEEFIDGFEVGCAVMGTDEIITGEIDEIELSDGFFNFYEKYNLVTSKIHVPARISKEKSDELKDCAKRIYRALDCNVFARVDMFLTSRGEIVFNEVNTIPGFTSHSRFPMMMEAAGLSFEEVIERFISYVI